MIECIPIYLVGWVLDKIYTVFVVGQTVRRVVYNRVLGLVKALDFQGSWREGGSCVPDKP